MCFSHPVAPILTPLSLFLIGFVMQGMLCEHSNQLLNSTVPLLITANGCFRPFEMEMDVPRSTILRNLGMDTYKQDVPLDWNDAGKLMTAAIEAVEDASMNFALGKFTERYTVIDIQLFDYLFNGITFGDELGVLWNRFPAIERSRKWDEPVSVYGPSSSAPPSPVGYDSDEASARLMHAARALMDRGEVIDLNEGSSTTNTDTNRADTNCADANAASDPDATDSESWITTGAEYTNEDKANELRKKIPGNRANINNASDRITRFIKSVSEMFERLLMFSEFLVENKSILPLTPGDIQNYAMYRVYTLLESIRRSCCDTLVTFLVNHKTSVIVPYVAIYVSDVITPVLHATSFSPLMEVFYPSNPNVDKTLALMKKLYDIEWEAFEFYKSIPSQGAKDNFRPKLIEKIRNTVPEASGQAMPKVTPKAKPIEDPCADMDVDFEVDASSNANAVVPQTPPEVEHASSQVVEPLSQTSPADFDPSSFKELHKDAQDVIMDAIDDVMQSLAQPQPQPQPQSSTSPRAELSKKHWLRDRKPAPVPVPAPVAVPVKKGIARRTPHWRVPESTPPAAAQSNQVSRSLKKLLPGSAWNIGMLGYGANAVNTICSTVKKEDE